MRMKLAFLINNFYPYGGMEKNFLRIVQACLEADFEVQIFTMSWQGEKPKGAEVILVPFKGLTNHGRGQSFVETFQQQFNPASFDLIVGFNRMPGLDLYYNADVCYVLDVARRRSVFSRLTSRYRTYSRFEKAVFGEQSSTQIMYLSEAEKKNYQQVYNTPDARFHYLPTGIDRALIRIDQTDDVRQQVRDEFGVAGDDFLLLLIGSGFSRKGVARAINGLGSLLEPVRSKVQLFVIGQGKKKKYQRQAQRLELAKQVHFMEGRDDVPRFLAAADLLIHPAVTENTGNVILEALVAGCAVLATGACGYGFHVLEAKAGCVSDEPFDQGQLNQLLAKMLDWDKLRAWGKRGSAYAERVDLYSRPQVAVEIIKAQVEKHEKGNQRLVFAFLLNNFHPYGGLEKSFLGILKACIAKGHKVTVFTMSWEGPEPDGAEVVLVPFRGLTNHGGVESFVQNFQNKFASPSFDLVVGFNRMPGLDLYYNADVCYVLDVARRRSFLSRLTRRYRTYASFEKAVFGVDSDTHIMSIAESEQNNYIKEYGTPTERFHALPAGIAKDNIRKHCTLEIRQQMRLEYGLENDEFMLLMIGSDFGRKGVARAITSIASLPRPLRGKVKLFIIGQGKGKKYRKQAKAAGLGRQVLFFGGRKDVPRFLAAADMLVHPAVSETAGNVILEAMVAGVAVLVTAACGFAFHVQKAKAGCLIPTPFVQKDMNDLLLKMLQTQELPDWARNGYDYADRVDLYSRPETAVAIMESLVAQRLTGEKI